MNRTDLGRSISFAGMMVASFVGASAANASGGGPSDHDDHLGDHLHAASGHAPIGVMGDHRHRKGELMLSYRYMHMDMSGNRIGTNDIAPEEIVTTIPNRFFGGPMQPPTLRVVPVNMQMDMHMVGAMYGLTDHITLVAMGSYIAREMDHIAFQGATGTAELGRFTTRSSGFGDSTVGALISLDSKGTHRFHVNAAIGIPTGQIDKRDDILTPAGGTPNVRLPYPMQLGSGSFDLKPGITYLGKSGDISWGGQMSATIRLERNSADYARSDRYEATAWIAKSLSRSFGISARMKAVSQGSIKGIDSQIAGPVQTADPDNFGGETVEFLFGANVLITKGPLAKNRFALEIGMPVYRDLNGPQLETDRMITLGWQRQF